MKSLKGFLTEGTRELYYADQFQEWNNTKWNHSPVAVGWNDGRGNQRKRFEIVFHFLFCSRSIPRQHGCFAHQK